MSIFEAVILGIVQGLAEFLPISSSGHLIMLQSFLGIEASTMMFNIVVHIGTLIPVLVIYRHEVIELIRRPFQRYTYLLITATLPAVAAALLLGGRLEMLFSTTAFLPLAFTATALLLIFAESRPEGRKGKEQITYLDSLIIGCVQAIGITPGISRSGSTIAAAIGRDISREAAARFSFMLSIPAIVGGFALELTRLATADIPQAGVGTLPLIFGLFSAMLTGFLAIRLLLELIRRRSLRLFSYYLLLLAAALTVINILF